MKLRAMLLHLIVIGTVSSPGLASATIFNIHVSGICSTAYTAELGQWAGQVSISAQVDQRNSMATATAQLKSILDADCTGNNWCYIYPYSNGGAVVSKALATYRDNWNIAYVFAAASNEGGSELGSGFWASLVVGCDLAAHISPSDHRPAWNHNDTQGVAIYLVAGQGSIFLTSGILDLFGGSNDGAVRFHSSGGGNTTAASSDICSESHFANHFAAGLCGGYSNNHLNMQRKAVCLDGGGGSCP